MIPLFEQYPLLRAKLPYVALGDFPTPVHRLERLEHYLGAERIYIKRDDMSGKIYGGNKTRKLEFLLGRALRAGVKSVLTFGYAGSNHALATAIYARQLGLQSISILLRQPNAHYVRANLLLSRYFNAELYHYENLPLLVFGAICQLLRYKLRDGSFPMVIAAGGSSPPGDVGFVNAALELRHQVDCGLLPEPDRIYVAAGTMGTAVGLMLGLKVARLQSQIVAVRVVDRRFVNEYTMLNHFRRLNDYLHAQDPSFPRFKVSGHDLDVRHGFFGSRYGLFTDSGMRAVTLMKQCEGITLEGTYTGKTLAALLADGAEHQALRGSTALFWNTCNSRDFSAVIAVLDYRQLPEPFHWYFEHDVQPLDSHCVAG